MKKMLALIVVAMFAVPAFGAWELSGMVDLQYVMPTGDGVVEDSVFASVDSELIAKGELDNGATAQVRLEIFDVSDGIETMSGYLSLEEIWVSKAGVFGQDAVSVTFGKMPVKMNQNFLNEYGVDENMTDMLDYTFGLAGAYDLGEGMGVITLTTFEGYGGMDTSGTDPEDEDSGLFTSFALQWDTGADAFGVAGLGLVVGYASLAQDNDADDGTIISIGATYALADLGLTFALEIDMMTWIPYSGITNSLNADDEAASMLMSLVVKYAKDNMAAYLVYEQHAGTGDYDLPTDDADTLTRLALIGEYGLSENVAMKLEYDSYSYAEAEDADWTQIAIGVSGTL